MANAPGEVCARPGCGKSRLSRCHTNTNWWDHDFVPPGNGEAKAFGPGWKTACDRPGCAFETPWFETESSATAAIIAHIKDAHRIPPVESRSAQGAGCDCKADGHQFCEECRPDAFVPPSPPVADSPRCKEYVDLRLKTPCARAAGHDGGHCLYNIDAEMARHEALAKAKASPVADSPKPRCMAWPGDGSREGKDYPAETFCDIEQEGNVACAPGRCAFRQADSPKPADGMAVHDGIVKEIAARWISPTSGAPIGAVREAFAAGRREGARTVEKKVGKVLADNGCDCCDEDGNDFEGPHEGRSCEEWGHNPCQMCQVEAALNAALETTNG